MTSHAAFCFDCLPVALCVAALGAAGVICGVGRRHGGRLGLGCIVQLVHGLYVLVSFFFVVVGFLLCPSRFDGALFERLLTR